MAEIKSIPIKTDLFKFVTVRTPQLIKEDNKNLGFIFNEDTQSSDFVKGVNVNTSIEDARTIIRNVLPSFTTPYETYLDVKKENTEFYNFSSWLMDNRYTLLKAEVDVKVVGISNLSPSELNSMWDNLYYQVLTRKSSYVRQACIQMIIASNFIKEHVLYDPVKHEMTEEEYLDKLAKAKVVIDKGFSVEENNAVHSSHNAKKIKEIIDRDFDKSQYKQNLENYKASIDELRGLKKTYGIDYKEAYKSAVKTRQAAIDALLTQAVIDDQKTKQEAEVIAARADKRPAVRIPYDIDYPKLNFTFDKPLSNTYMSTLSSNTKDILASLNITDKYTIEDALASINNEIEKISNKLFSLVKTSEQTISVNGVALKPYNYALLQPYCFVINVKRNNDLTSSLAMFINLGANNIILSQSHTLTIVSPPENYTTNTSQDFSPVNQTYTILQLFANEVLSLNGIAFNLTGEIVLSNGVTLQYDVDVPVEGYYKSCMTTDTNNNSPSNDAVELYGTNKIGIGDFRKVEQEVCCYIPGHVSHIENILAKEYKERATRSLLSSESTTETTTEKEVENLTDTTTTERNEMQSEVSNVLNEDSSSAYGASAGVSGTINSVDFRADGYADFANSSSSSQSNSNAQSYAQEVTERTLERIVKKTTKKRTSRILREFEENNKHGFDNREGVQHVSGVYRWVDIIYKNRLVNYGKRLMYEFMIPEPARFFHEAIHADNNSDDCSIEILEKPLHPSELELGVLTANDSTGLTSINYQKIASVYGIEVSHPPERYKSTGVSFTKSQSGDGADSDVNKAEKSEIDVPKGYRVVNAISSVIAIGDGDYNLTVNVGDDHYQYTGFDTGAHDFQGVGEHTEKIPVSAYFSRTWVGTVNINVIFERTDELLQQWENETYAAIIEAYEDRLRAYNEAKLAQCIGEKQFGDSETVRFNPLFNRAIEKREIKRIGIEMLTKPFNNPMGRDNYEQGETSDAPAVSLNEEFENHAAHVKFFEQAFDWEIMAYLFYPYYWAKKADWKTLFQKTEAADPIFQAFLQSGMARAVIPVRPGFEDAVLYYMNTGDIWNGGDLVLDQEDDLYISIADEMANIQGEVEDTWETKVPTNLTIIQKDTIGLDETGLPCCKDIVENEEENPIQPKEDKLGVVLDNQTT